ncbi:MAG: T9SS type A sorting domain-containing protein, partial [Bacteroidales bacterium]|nr:T9SS type A sorting domain-containing protein [Bacteroidales bacterium]
ERSVDGKEFTNLAKINGAGNSNIILNYQFTDTEPLSGVSYYRLKQTDFDGEFAYSDIIVINYTSDEEANVSIYPNPSNSIINIDLGGFVEDNIVEMNIYSMNGKLVANKQIAIDKNGNADISMNVKTILPSGIYFIMIIGNTSTVSHKIIIE